MKEISVAFFSIAIASVAYLSGYGYLFGYFNYFGIGLNELNFSVQDITAHAMIAVLGFVTRYFLLVVALLLLTGLLLLAKFGSKPEKVEILRAFLVAAVLLSIVATMKSREIGREAARQELRNLDIVAVDAGISKQLIEIFGDFSSLSLRHLYSDNGITILIGTFLGNSKDGGMDRWVIRLERGENVAFVVYQDPS